MRRAATHRNGGSASPSVTSSALGSGTAERAAPPPPSELPKLAFHVSKSVRFGVPAAFELTRSRMQESMARRLVLTGDRITADEALSDMVLVKNSRLSVQPVTAAEWRRICKLGGFEG